MKDFLWGIRLNNNREWFLANKEAYTQYLYEPTKTLGAHLYELFKDSPRRLEAEQLARYLQDAGTKAEGCPETKAGIRRALALAE